MNISEYARRLGIETPTAKAADIEKGKSGYQKYLDDTANGKIYLPSGFDSLESYAQRVDEWRYKSFGEKLKARLSNITNKIGIGGSDNDLFYMGSEVPTDPLMRFLKGEISREEFQAVKRGIADQDYARPEDDWTDEERWAFGEAYAESASKAFALAEEINSQHAAAKKQKQAERISNWTDRNVVNKVLGSVGSLVINAVAGGAAYAEALGQKAVYGRTYDKDYLMPHEIANTIQGTVSENLSEKNKALGYIYNIGMSVGQSTLAGVTGGSAGALVQFFGMSASNGFTDAKSRGADDNQALAFGTLSGLAEAIPEMISVDKFLGLASAAQVDNVFKSILKQAGAEALEEATTSVLTEVADRWVMQGKSNYALTVQELIASGMTEAEAKKKAFTQTLLEIAGDAVTGAISGTASGGIAVGFNKLNNKYFQRKTNTEAKEALTPEASNLIEEGKKHESSTKQAERLEKKLAEGKELSGYELRMLAHKVSEATNNANVDTVRQAIIEKMKAEGVKESDAKRLGEIALNKALGNEVSKIQDVMLRRNENALKVYNEFSNIDKKMLQFAVKNGTIEAEQTNGVSEYENENGVHLRNSGKRTGGTNTEGQVSGMESSSGQVESRRKTTRIADSEAARIVNEGREVKASKLGIPGASTTQTVRIIDKGNETTSMKKARKEAESRGLKVNFFVGNNISIVDESGKKISARAYIKGNEVYVRADHSLYTAEQLMRHEIGHDLIAKGEVDINAVRERLSKKAEKNIDKVAELYADAYAGTGMTEQEIWEECICDSLGEMNIFADEKISGKLLKKALPKISKATKQSKTPTQTRGSPDGKTSRETKRKTKIRNTVKYLSSNKVGASNMEYIRSQLRNLYRGVSDGIADGIAIGDGNTVYIVDSGRENGKLDFGVRRMRTFSADIAREAFIRRENDKARSNGNISNELLGNFARGWGSNFGRSLRRESGTELQADKTESQNQQNGVSGENANQRGLTEEFSSPEEAKASGKVSDAKFSIEFADDIANKQRKFVADGLSRISSEELEKAIADTAHMVEEMKPYANILPQDKVGKTLVKNGSYDVSVENTTVCIRTLAYNSFVDMVSEKVGRPLTQMESFLVSQKLYEIAKEPQCLYCYVSLDRKAFNEMVIRYTEQRDAVIKAYEKAGKPKIPSKFDAEWSLFKKFLDGRKPTTNMWDRYVGWLKSYNKGEKLVSLSDISTEVKRLELVENGGEIASQVKDMLKYAQSASWAKKQTQYVAYYDEILKLKPAIIRNLNNHYGMRWYSFSDYSGAFIVENMQQITDAAIRGLKGLSYTKDTDFAEIFAPTGMNINISVYAKKTENGYEIDAKQSANIEEAIKLRDQYPNVGIVVVATDKAGVEWALAQEWSDVVIPFHTVRTGADVAEFYNWEIFNSEQNDTVTDQNLWDAYVNDVGKKKASKMVYPSEHQNNRETYLSICEKRGLTPRFKSFLDNPNYMKLVNETRQSESQTSPLKATYNLEAAERSFDKFVEKGGYYEGWYNDGIDVDGEAEIVAEDVKAGKKANEVGYGRQDIDFDGISKNRKTNRQHGKASRELDTEYISAVNRGDMETAQRMVDEAAKEAGYTVKGLHATNAEFNVFDISKTSEYNYHGKGIYFTNSQKDVESNYENYEGADPWQKIEAEAYEMLYDKYGLSYEDTLTSDSEIIDKLNECYDEVIDKFKKTLRRITAYLKFDNPLIIGKGELASDYDLSKYDGIIDNHVYENIGHSGMDENTVHYIVLNPNNIKSADPVTYDDNGNVIPLSERFNTKNSDIRYSREMPNKSKKTVTSGQYAQTKANLSHSKVYSKVSTMEFVSKIAPGIRNRSFEALSNELWEGLNTYTTIDDKRAFASDMSEMFIDRMIVDTLAPNPEWSDATEKISYLKTAINSINFTAEERTEIRHILDIDGLRRTLGRWGYKNTKNKRPYDLDVFITDISREMPGMEYLNEMHPVDALMEIDSLYEELSATLKEKYESAYKDLSDAELDEIKRSIEADIMKAYDELGEQSAISKYLKGKLEYYQDRIDFWKAENAKTNAIARWNGILSTKAQHIRDLKKGAFYNATQHHQDVFKESIEELAKIQWRGNITPKRIREVFAKLKPWYSKDNPMLYDAKSEDNLYSETIATYIEKIADTTKDKFEVETYAMVYEVMNHLYTMMRNYNKVFRAGRWEDAPTLVDSYLKIMEETKRQRGALGRLRDGYTTEFLEPMAVARRADGYDPNGFFTQTMEDLRRASINASVGEMNLRKEYDGFIDANKKYLSEAANTTINYRGVEVPKLNLIGLYMTMKRKHARAGLALNGFTFAKKNKWWDSEDFVKVPGYLSAENVTQEMIDTETEEQMKVIEQSFTETDKEYIRILEKLFNEDLKALKVERDMERQGYTNATLDYYYPIMRGAMAENVDTAKISDQNRATNASFNKNTVTGAKQRLVIISADAMVNRHITDMCKYYYMSQAIENYNVLYNCDISGNANNPVNISGFVKEHKIWDKDSQYFKKLVSDMQGIRDPQTTFEKAIEGMRGGYAKFALGANLKVLFTQFSSMIAAGDVISYGSILSAKKFNISSADVDKYCPLAAVRSYDKTVLRAMTLTDKFGKVSEALTLGISKVDRYVVKRLFAACQIEAQKKGLGELGTEENKIAAGKLLEKVIIETQQNSFATERSSAMRSKNEFLKSITMFTADGMKIVSRMYDAFGELKAAKKSGDKVRIKSARKNLAKTIATAVNIAIYMTAIATLFNWLYDRDDEEDESKLLSLTMDTVGNFIGALPLISDFYDYMVDGFEVEGVAFDTINNLFSGINNIRKDVGSVISGDGERSKQDINRDLRTMLYGVGQVTGLPFRNIYNLSRGIIGKFSSVGGYKLDSKFYETSLATDLDKAIESGDNAKTAYIMALIYDDKLDETVSKDQIEEITRLTKEGYNVLPRDIPDEITRNGKKYKLTAEQKDIYMETYSQVVAAIDKLISSSFYIRSSTKEKADLIAYYHDQYREMAVNKALKFTDKKETIYSIVGFDKFVEYTFSIKGIESDKDKNGNTISGSKKAKVIEKINDLNLSYEKKLLLIAYSGYTIDDAKEREKLLKYINRLKLSTSNKKKLADMLDFEYKNGTIVNK